MKKLFFCLAATALMTIGCSGKANAYKVSEKEFDAEITNYGFVLNNNAKFEGIASMPIDDGVAEQTLTMEFDSQGEHKRFKVHQYLEGEGDMDSVGEITVLENGNYNLDWYRKSFGDTSYALVKNEDISLKELKSFLNEIVYLPSIEYKDLKFKKDNNSYHCDSYKTEVNDHGMTITIVYSNLNIQLKDKKLFALDFSLLVSGMGSSFQMEKTQSSGISIELPTIE